MYEVLASGIDIGLWNKVGGGGESVSSIDHTLMAIKSYYRDWHVGGSVFRQSKTYLEILSQSSESLV